MTETARSPLPPERSRATRLSLALAAAVLSLAGCSGSGPKTWQGYLEGDFIYVAAPIAGRLETLAVEKGSRVRKGAPLFGLEHAAESDALRQASQELKASKSQLEDLMKGSRPDEIAALEAKLGQSRAAAELSRLDLARQAELFKAGAISASDFDRARLTHEANTRAVDEDAAQPRDRPPRGQGRRHRRGRRGVHAAAEAEAHARWSVDQKAQAAPGTRSSTTRSTARVSSSPRQPRRRAPSPGNLKVRFFVSEQDFGLIKAGDRVSVAIDGLPAPLEARVSYLSPQPEYTPPVLYNRDNRSKLVYMIEAVFAGNAAADLHPGEPVDVSPAAR